MSARLTMMAAVATSLFAFAPAASAADLDYPPEEYSRYEPGYEPTYDSGYRSPRYSDPYADGPPPGVFLWWNGKGGQSRTVA